MIDKPIAVCSRTFSKSQYLRAEILKKFSDVTFNDEGLKIFGEELIHFLKDKAGAIIALEQMTEEVVSRLPRLEAIGKYGVGLDNIYPDVLDKYKVKFGWTGGLNRRSVSELVLGLSFNALRNIAAHSSSVKNAQWKNLGGAQLSDKTFGIIGMGHIGKDLVSLLKPFNCKILVNDIIDIDEFCKEHGLISVNKEEIYEQADIISVHTPITDLTRDLISKKEMKTMKDTAIVINTARGGIINEQDLYEVLSQNLIGAAGIDVFVDEPLVNSPLFELSNFIATPHIAGSSNEGIRNMGLGAIENLVKLLS